MSEIFVDNIKHQSSQGSGTITLGASGETIALASGASVTGNGLVGITMADQWRLTADTNSGTDAVIATNWERNDSTGYGGIGTGLTESSGIFSFPSTGIYYILFIGRLTTAGSDTSSNVRIQVTQDNSSFTEIARSGGGNGGTNAKSTDLSTSFVFDVTDTSTHKFRTYSSSFSVNTKLMGITTRNETHVTVLRLGDT